MKPLQKTDSLEGFMRRQERLLKQNEFYKRLIVIPLIVIAVSISVLAYNLTAGRRPGFVKSKGQEVVAVKAQEPFDQEPTEKINLNTATADMLDALPGLGPKKAAAIIELREKMGGYKTVEDILNVDGIGEATLAEIQHMIYVETD